MSDSSAYLLNQPLDVSHDFEAQENTFFHVDAAKAFDPATASGTLNWLRHCRKVRMAGGQVVVPYEASKSWEFPPEYGQEAESPFSLTFVTPRTVRLRVGVRPEPLRDEPSLMLEGPLPKGSGWRATAVEGGVDYRSAFGTVSLRLNPWRIEFRDAKGELLTSTVHPADRVGLLNCHPVPFSFARRASDLARRFAASFSLAPDEKIFGCGESFTRLNKRGQKIPLWTIDAHGVQHPWMYKPVPFFMSDRGYGMFAHTTAPMTCDFGNSHDATTTLFLGEESLDLFFFVGAPKDVLAEYTALTGRSPMPPLWSFGLWMSRITYKSEQETREVAKTLRDQHVPCDVIHLDTGWFETDWRCDYQFSPTRFENPAKMIADLRKIGFRVSLWQLPYFTPTNPLYREAVEKGYVVRRADGDGLPTEDAVVDFSNPDAVKWYQGLLAGLLKMGVGAIKVDFGEGAPLHGMYASGKSGFHEHNLYPLRYNKAVAEITREVTGENVIWARSAWAGSQRYPLHWGGDAENTDSAMAASLRGGLSFGLCGFSFWSHDIGGFVRKSPEALYRRWLPFGMLTSHSRCHGAPPKEPWAYGEAFTDDFRRGVELKYRLMPYVYAQAKASSEQGLPMMRALFLEYPEDPTSWLIEDEYLFGADLLVAPLFEEKSERRVYLPPGQWIDYQTGRVYAGTQWHTIAAGEIPVILLVRDGAALPHAAVAQSTDDIDWQTLELRVFAAESMEAEALVCLPQEGRLHRVRLEKNDGAFQVAENPLPGTTKLTVTQKSLPGSVQKPES